jgi:hypothetical protein
MTAHRQRNLQPQRAISTIDISAKIIQASLTLTELSFKEESRNMKSYLLGA